MITVTGVAATPQPALETASKIEPSLQAELKPSSEWITVTGALNADESCNGDYSATVWVTSQNHNVLPSHLPIRSTFEFHLPPGRYQIVVRSSSNCSAEQSFEVSDPSKPFETALKLEKTLDKKLPPQPSMKDIKSFRVSPRFYVSGRPGVRFKASVAMESSYPSLGMIPAHGAQGWDGKLHVDGKIFSGNALHPYFQYEYELRQQPLQDRSGFCIERAGLFNKLGSLLRQAGFLVNEVSDMEKELAVAVPVSQRYCVYPQTSSILNPMAAFKIDPVPASVTRFLFIVVTEEALQRKLASGNNEKFAHAPSNSWDVAEELSKGPRHPASVSEIDVHEWAIGWIHTTPQ